MKAIIMRARHSPALSVPGKPGRKRRRDVRISALSLFLAVLLDLDILHFSILPAYTGFSGSRESEYIIESYRTVVEAAEYIKREFIGETDAAAIKDGAIRGMIDSLDERIVLRACAGICDYLESTNNEYVGIGVRHKEEGAYILVEKVTEDCLPRRPV